MRVIRGYGIRAVCVESRPHPDYVGPTWWQNMDIIMDEAERLGMRVWVLDDSRFPTGYCNGQISVHPEYGKVFLDHYTIDVRGPMKNAQFIIRLEEGERLLGVTAGRRLEGQSTGKLVDAVELSECVRGDLIEWDVPEGYWNIIILKTTPRSDGRKNYCNLLDKKAVRFFLDTVYEPHWEHYQDKFGTVFAGFFSDEPELGNVLDAWPDSSIGNPTMTLPWCDELEKMAGECWGEKRNLYLSALWCDTRWESRITVNDNAADTKRPDLANIGVKNPTGRFGEDEGAENFLWECARYEYMNMVTDLYGRNFCIQVGQWCAAHGVEYIGHIIEDNGTHARTGYGTGHFFKALWGQHMSGIDVVLQQIRPGFNDRDFYNIGGKNTYNGVFFHYGLAKLGSSLAHLDPVKQGRTICEVFGAYGWTEGLKLMKWIADHMLVRGVNYFVPHAFTPAPFPDPDCPPHFYAHGMNPQYPYFGELAVYMNRVSHLISGGEHQVRIAVLYTAEVQWIKGGESFENLGMLLLRNQFDYDVVPIGLLETGVWTAEKRLRIGCGEYSVLILPACRKVPEELSRWISEALMHGFPVIALGDVPCIVSSGWRQAECFDGWRKSIEDKETLELKVEAEIGKADAEDKKLDVDGGKTDPDLSGMVLCGNDEDKLLCEISHITFRTVECADSQPGLRCYRYRHSEGEYALFFQEDTVISVVEWVTLPGLTGECPGEQEKAPYLYWYDAMENRLEKALVNTSGKVWLELGPGEAKILCALRRKALEEPLVLTALEGKALEVTGNRALEGTWQLFLKNYKEKAYGVERKLENLVNVTAAEEMPDFSGVMRYEKRFLWNVERDGGEAILDCGEVYETLVVYLNGKRQGVRIAPPYRLLVKGLRTGENCLVLEVINTLVHSQKDFLSVTMPVDPSGLLGPVYVKTKTRKELPTVAEERSSY